ncbi:MAG: response regulator [Planctomycetota bacterium]
MKILIIDDSAVMRMMIKRMLTKAGIDADILEASNGEEGLLQLPNEPDLILCDWNMPEMDGMEFLRRIRADQVTIPLVMVTTETHFARKGEALRAGANGFLSKPFTPQELAHEIEQSVTA